MTSREENIASTLGKIREKAPELADRIEGALGIQCVSTCIVCGQKNRVKPGKVGARCGRCGELFR